MKEQGINRNLSSVLSSTVDTVCVAGFLLCIACAGGCSLDEHGDTQDGHGDTHSRFSPTQAPKRAITLRTPAEAREFAVRRLGGSFEPGIPFEDQLRSLKHSNLTRLDFLDWLDHPTEPAILICEDGIALAIGHVSSSRTGKKIQILDDRGLPAMVGERDLAESGCNQVFVNADESPVVLFVSDCFFIDRGTNNFGLVKPSSDLKTTFDFINTSDHSVLLEAPVASCSCVSIDPFNPFTIPPRSNRQVNVRIDNVSGTSFSHKIEVPIRFADSTQASAVQLFLHGNIEESLIVSPATLDFGTCRNSSPTQSRTLCLSEVATDRFEITNVEVPAIYKVVEHRTTKTQDGFLKHCFEVSLDPSELAPGVHVNTVVIDVTSTLRPLIEVPVRFHIVPPIIVVPDTLAFGNVMLDGRVTRTVTVECDGMVIESIGLAGGADDLDIAETIFGSSASLDVTFTPTKLGVFNKAFNLIVSTTNGREATIALKVAAWVK